MRDSRVTLYQFVKPMTDFKGVYKVGFGFFFAENPAYF